MTGSQRKIRLVFDDLERLGVAREKIERIHRWHRQACLAMLRVSAIRRAHGKRGDGTCA